MLSLPDLFSLNSIDITYKKWQCTLYEFTCYLTVGAFLVNVFDMNDAFHLAEPLLPNTNLTAWVMAPMYVVSYAIILLVVEIVKKRKINNK